jgi:hypothetical protein
VVIAFEEVPRFRLVAQSLEDEHRLRLWLALAKTQRRAIAALQDALEEFEEAA